MNQFSLVWARSFIAILFLLLMSSTAGAINSPNLSVTTSGLNVSLSWSSVPGATRYYLYYAPNPYQGRETIGEIDMGTGTSISFDLWDGASFYVTVTAYDETPFGESGYSNVELFTTTESVMSVWYQDYDGDGYGNPNLSQQSVGQPDGFVANITDCNDLDSIIYPGAEEIFDDGVDQDCDGEDSVAPSEWVVPVSVAADGEKIWADTWYTGPAELSIDGNNITAWTYDGLGSITFDLGAVREVSGVSAYWGGSVTSGNTVNVYVGDVKVVSEDQFTASTNVREFEAVSGRYITYETLPLPHNVYLHIASWSEIAEFKVLVK